MSLTCKQFSPAIAFIGFAFAGLPVQANLLSGLVDRTPSQIIEYSVDDFIAREQVDPAVQIKIAVMKVLDDWLAGFNQLDTALILENAHFPHYRLASGGMVVTNSREDVPPNFAELIQLHIGEEWHHSAWDRREIIHLSDSKVHVDTRFTRYREDGSVIESFDSLYVLTKENGRWGVKLRSSFAP